MKLTKIFKMDLHSSMVMSLVATNINAKTMRHKSKTTLMKMRQIAILNSLDTFTIKQLTTES